MFHIERETLAAAQDRGPDEPPSCVIPIEHVQAPTRHEGRTRPLIWCALALILALASVLRFTGLDREGRWGDEYRQTRAYTLPIRFVVEEARSAGQPPLDYLIGWALAKVGQSDRMRRLPAAFFGVMGVAAVFFLARRLACDRVGLLAAALLALCPLHWALSQDARPYSIATALMIIALLTLLRALDRADRRRIAVYGAACYVFTLTIGLLPLVVLCAICLVLPAFWLIYRSLSTESERSSVEPAGSMKTRMGAYAPSVQAKLLGSLQRVGLATLAVGIATVPLVLYLLADEGYTVFSEAGRRSGDALGRPFLPRFIANAAAWMPLAGAMFGWAWPLVIASATAGILLCLRGRNASAQPPDNARWAIPAGHPTPRLANSPSDIQGLGAKCVFVIMVLIGPLYLLTFSVSVPVAPIRIRYGSFLAPVVAIFAAIALVAVIRGLGVTTPLRRLGRQAAALTIVLLLAGPATAMIGLTGKYYREDWRGCAAYLADRVGAEDVIMVYEDRPVGDPRMTFWGKYDWPADMAKPLAEPVRSLAQSDSHWQRLCRRTGRCIAVIRYQVGAETKHEFHSHGLQQAPAHLSLTKFRGLDLLERIEPSKDPIDRMIDACDDLLGLPKQSPEGDAFVYALRSRLQFLQGDVVAARLSFEQSQAVVPAELRPWFLGEMAVHVAALRRTETVAESGAPVGATEGLPPLVRSR